MPHVRGYMYIQLVCSAVIGRVVFYCTHGLYSIQYTLYRFAFRKPVRFVEPFILNYYADFSPWHLTHYWPLLCTRRFYRIRFSRTRPGAPCQQSFDISLPNQFVNFHYGRIHVVLTTCHAVNLPSSDRIRLRDDDNTREHLKSARARIVPRDVRIEIITTSPAHVIYIAAISYYWRAGVRSFDSRRAARTELIEGTANSKPIHACT